MRAPRAGMAGWRFVTTKPLGAASGLILLTMALLAVFAGRISPYDPIEVDLRNIRSAPSAEHVLGTDYNGRDVLSRILHGGRISLTVGLLSVVLGTGLGAVWGLVSGYLGGEFDLLTQRLLEVILSFPSLVLAMIFMVAFGARRAWCSPSLSPAFRTPPASSGRWFSRYAR